jgi:hypothetical protein
MADCRIRDVAACNTNSHGARDRTWWTFRPHTRNTTIDRQKLARGRRYESTGRTHDHNRLRRPASRRRHAHRCDHRCLRRFALASNSCSRRKISRTITTDQVAAVSVGIVGNTPLLDLKYDEDSRAEVDMNIVCTGDGRFIELQGTAEREPFSRAQMDELVALGVRGIQT